MATVKPPDCTIKTPPGHPQHQEELLDEAIQESFPASDPVSISIEAPPEPQRPDRPADESKPAAAVR